MATSARRFCVGLLSVLSAFAASASAQPVPPTPVPGRNVNLSSGPAELNTSVTPPVIRGDFLLKQQNEGSCAMSARNPKNILCGANDYRLVDVPGVDPAEVTRDAWGGVFQSANGGDTWESTVMPGHFLDPAPSLLKSYRAMADPVVRSGAAGVTYMTGLAFKGPSNSSIIYIATFLDLNNKENDPTPFTLVRLTQVDWGPDGQFLDKPWQVVLPPEGTATCSFTLPNPDRPEETITQTVPDSPVIIGYSIFVGHPTDSYRTKQIIARVTNCGATVERRVKVSESQKINQAMAIAASPVDPRMIVAVWRRFAEGSETDAMLASVSTDGGITWTKPIVSPSLGLICPFDQNATATKFRTQSFPTLAAGPNGKFYLAWADRGKDATGACQTSGTSRIVLSSSADGVNWSTPSVVDDVGYGAHQVNPSLTVGGNTLHLLWQDMRDSESGYFDDPKINEYPLLRAAMPGSTEYPAVPRPVKHNTIEIYSKMAALDSGPLVWGQSVPVTQYKQGAYKDKTGARHYGQIQWNMPNLRLFAKGLKAFNGDYVDAATPPMLPPEGARTNWMNNTGQGDPFFFSVWTDNRDVRRSAAQSSDDETQPTPYTPVGRTGTSLADPTQQCPVCVPGAYEHTGTMNQNLYGARINRGFVAYAPGNNKRIHYSTKFGQEFQRAYVVMVRNDSSDLKTFHLTIPPEYQTFAGGTASFEQFNPAVYQLLVRVPKHSSASRTVYLSPDGDPATPSIAKIRVDVTEVVGGADAAGGASVYINPDPTAPEVEAPEVEAPEVEAEEVYAPEVEAPEVEAPEVEAPEVEAPEVEAPEVEAPEVEAPEVEATSYLSPEVEAPEVEAPEVEAPEVEAPEVEAAAITDIVWPMKNNGNTTAGYILRPTVSGDLSGYDFQLIVSRIVKLPTAKSCAAAEATMNRVAVIVDANRLVDPNQVILPEDPDYATAWVNPRQERVLVTLRVRTKAANGVPLAPIFNPAEHVTSLAVTPQAVDTEDVIVNGDTTPDPVIVTAIPAAEFVNAPTGATSTRPISPPVSVRLKDQFGQPYVPDPPVAVTLAFGSAPAPAELTGNVATTDALGIATFDQLAITGAGENFTLVASAPGVAPAESAPFMVLEACAADGQATTASSVMDGPGINSEPVFVRDADFDGNPYRDVVVVHNNGTITKANGTGRGVFSRGFSFTMGQPNPNAAAVADFNEDGFDDIIATYSSSNLVGLALSNPSAGVFAVHPPTTLNVGVTPHAVVTGDFDRDGFADAAVALYGDDAVAVLYGDGTGAFSAPVLLATVGPNALATGDFNGDGWTDIVGAGRAEVVIFLGGAGRTFTEAGSRPAGAPMIAVATADFDRDGLLDVATASYVAAGPVTDHVAVLVGDGAGGLTLLTRVDPLGPALTALTAGDFDADGDPDLAVAGAFGPSRFAVMFNDGTGLFGAPQYFTAGTEPVDVWAAEVTNDARDDLVIANRGVDADGFDTISVLIGSCGAVTADMAAVSTIAPNPARFADTVNWTIVATNNGPFPATGARLVGSAAMSSTTQGYDALVSLTPGCTVTGSGFDCTLGTLPSGSTSTVEFQLTNVQVGTIRTFVNAVAEPLDKVPGNTRSVVSIVVQASPTTFVVTNVNDNGPGSLRQAMLNANQNVPAADTITFAIPGGGVHTITLESALPTLTDTVAIDATTQPLYAGTPLIQLSAGPVGGRGFHLAAVNSSVRGFVINGFSGDAIYVTAPGATITANYLGTDATGTSAAPNQNGVAIENPGTATVGGSNPADRNVLSGNRQHGVQFYGSGGNSTIRGNYIGTNANGTGAVPNQGNGITMYGGGNNLVEGNVLSGNAVSGIGVYSPSNAVRGNHIGTDVSGTIALPNGLGVFLCYAGGNANVVGGTTSAARNVISGNTRNGVQICANGNTISGNFIGVTADGSAPLPNQQSGIVIESGAANTIGGSVAGAGNVISGNLLSGLRVLPASSGTVVSGNYVGLNAAGSVAIPNIGDGMQISGAAVIGGTTAEARNVVSGNTVMGIAIFNPASGITVTGNYIGTDAFGTAPVRNGGAGVSVANSPNNVIGGSGPGEWNVISGNAGSGIVITGVSSTNNVIRGNLIGVGPDAVTLLGNLQYGIAISLDASSTIVGSDVSSGTGGMNVIAGNTLAGIVVRGVGTRNVLAVNGIFSNGGLGIDLNDDGVSGNDDPDVPAGANNTVNYPEVTAAIGDGTMTAIRFILRSTPNTRFAVDLYENSSCDPSGSGEGERWLSRYGNISTDATGLLLFSDTQAVGVPPGRYITATATNEAGDTSEFSACFRVMSSLSGTAFAEPAANARGVTFHLVAHVTPGQYPPSSGVAVAVDATAIGGPAALPLNDEGPSGGDGCDEVAGDNTFTACTQIAPFVSSGLKVLPVTITDAEGRLGETTISVTVLNSGVTGRFEGRVLDANGAPIPGTSVSVMNLATLTWYSAVTDATGDFIFPALPAGTYRTGVTQQEFTLEAGQTVGLTLIY